MKIFYALTALFAFSSAQDLETVGENEADVGKHLYTTSLRAIADGTTQCGGSLIAPNVVLTSAQCTYRLWSPIKYAVVGSHKNGGNGAQDGETIEVKKLIKHPKFNDGSRAYDFALFILANDSKYAPVKLSFDNVGANVTSFVRGWGLTKFTGSESDVLLEAVATTIDDTTCRKLLPDNYNFDNTMMCAGGKEWQNACNGDSGGPMTIETDQQETLVGVVSWGIGCGKANAPGVYGRISAARDFIEPYLSSTSKTA
ncbi:hypothetical protein LEN26_009170 [Aphanomyces euteiches]|nr:hypothetical protein AeMF1_013840 [Aphanomyces euteiches]KAH9128067.1 hypothetical protein LEN26_009170 [Aphanomyces euteiches]KAH9182835.1 hypothetical protein AeNC1_015188 [Aphanomyces euteiches]